MINTTRVISQYPSISKDLPGGTDRDYFPQKHEVHTQEAGRTLINSFSTRCEAQGSVCKAFTSSPLVLANLCHQLLSYRRNPYLFLYLNSRNTFRCLMTISLDGGKKWILNGVPLYIII